jgi:hypothetical protein
VEDAAADLWRQDHLTANPAEQSPLSPTEEELTRYIAQLREQGLDGSVHWGRLASEMQCVQDNEVTDLSDQVDYLASRYVAVLDKLERNASGEQLKGQKAELEQLWKSATQSLTVDFSQFLQETLGLSPESAGQIEDSLTLILYHRVEEYQGALTQVNVAVAQAGADSKWLHNHDGYLAARLREAVSPTDAETIYSIHDLLAAGTTANAYQDVTGGHDEARLALDLAMADMETEVLLQKWAASPQMTDLLRASRPQAHGVILDEADQYWAENARLSGKPDSFAAVDRALVEDIYRAVMDAYQQNGGDAAAAIRAGVSYGQTATAKAGAAHSGVPRWEDSMQSYWKNFYTVPTFETGSAQWQAAQALAQLGQSATWVNSAYQNYVNIWHDFLVALDVAA